MFEEIETNYRGIKMEEQQIKANAYKVEHDKPIRKFDIQENGDVILTETVTSKVFFAGREFISYIRGFEQSKEMIEKQQSDEFKKEAEEEANKNLEELNEVLLKIAPMQPEVETIMKENYEKQKIEQALKALQEQLALPADKFNKNYFQAFLTNVPEEAKEKIILKLTDEEKSKFLKIKAKMKRNK